MTNQLQHQPRRSVDLRIPAIEKYAYCLCLHVKPTTIFIAVFKLMRSLVLASLLLNAEFTINDGQTNGLTLTLEDRYKSTELAFNLLARLFVSAVSAGAIYGVIFNRAALLMPLYACLLVDFFFTLPAFYNRDLVDPPLSDSFSESLKNYPHRDPQLSRHSSMLLATISMIARIYFLCVIWKCYRYLRLIELVSPLHLSEVYPHIGQSMQYPIVRVLGSTDSTDLAAGCGGLAPPSYDSIAANMKPPNYEEATKSTDASRNPSPSHVYPSTTVIVNPASTAETLHQQDVVSPSEIPSSSEEGDSRNVANNGSEVGDLHTSPSATALSNDINSVSDNNTTNRNLAPKSATKDDNSSTTTLVDGAPANDQDTQTNISNSRDASVGETAISSETTSSSAVCLAKVPETNEKKTS